MEELNEIYRECRKDIAEEDEAAIQNGTATLKIRRRHTRWLNGKEDTKPTAQLVLQRVYQLVQRHNIFSTNQTNGLP